MVRHNSISDPRRLQPGDRVRIPVGWLKRQPAQATVLEVRGDAQLLSSAGVTPLKNGMKLGAGSRLSVGRNASLKLQFADGSELELSENSNMALDALSTLATTGMVDTRLRLQRGRSQIRVVPFVGPGSRFEIETPSATAAVRGTDFRASAVPERKVMRSEVIDGAISLAASGVDVAVPAGFGTLAETGKPPLKPRPLLPAPALPPYGDVFRLLPVRFAWPAIKDAMSYRLRLIPGANQPGQVREFVVQETELILDDIANGEYQLAVRGIDSVELEGFDAMRAIRVQALLPAPKPGSPPPSGIERVRTPHFAWPELAGAKRYRLTLFNADDGQRVGRWETEKPELALPMLIDQGNYTWKLAALDARGIWGETSAPSAFRVKDPPQSPILSDAAGAITSGVVQWKRRSPQERVRLQLATDRDFQSVVQDQTVDADQWTIQNLLPGTYYLRLRTIDADGEESPFSGARAVVVPLPLAPSAPLALQPVDAKVTRTCVDSFEWSATERAADYQLTIRDAGDLDTVVFEATALKQTTFTLEAPLVSGTYEWAVSARDQYGQVGAASEPRRWVCKAEPPVPEFVTSTAQGNTILLRWRTIDEIDTRYDVQLARDEAFGQMVQQARVAVAEMHWDQIEPGRYFARARVVDADGYTGRFGPTAAITVLAPPPSAPRLLAPADGTVSRACPMNFEWIAAERASAYWFVLRKAEPSRTVIVDASDLTDTRYRLQPVLAPGTYEWQVTGRDEHYRFGASSAPARLVCKEEPPAPTIESAEVQSKAVTMRWSSADIPGARYQVRIAMDATFLELVAEEQTQEPELTVQLQHVGSYFARVRVIDTDGYTGAFGPALRFVVETPARQ